MHDKKIVLVPVSNGAEEIETTSIVDVLRRAEIDVIMASIHEKSKKTPIIKGSRGIGLVCDGYLEDYLNKDFDMIALSGGAGNAENLAKCTELIDKLKAQREAKKWYAAMCASPAVVFLPHGLVDGEEVTCYPSFAEKFKKYPKYSEERVVVSNNCITSRGPGTAIEFALTLVEKLATKEKAAQLAKGLLAYIPK
jgi:protein deglycase